MRPAITSASARAVDSTGNSDAVGSTRCQLLIAVCSTSASSSTPVRLCSQVKGKAISGPKQAYASTSQPSPPGYVPSLADRVSKALDGFPAKGEDGFLWLADDGTRRTTRQAFTVFEGAGAYHVPKGSEVLAPLAAGWPAFVEDRIPEDNAELLMRAAVGWDVFFLCPERALAGFERAAGQGSAIAAYNAAVMRLERNVEGDRAAALALLERGAALGDAKSDARLAAERLQAR